jgi:NTE family protein
VSHIQRQRQIHRMRHIIAELSQLVPEERRNSNLFDDLKSYGCLTRMHVVRLIAPALDHEDHSKDIDFSASGVRRRREAGYSDTMRTLEKAPWRNPVDELEGFVLHEASGGQMVATAASR